MPPPSDTLAAWSLDSNDDGSLNDGERDADGDTLGNWDEAHGQMTEAWWAAKHNGVDEPKESPYPDNFLDNADLPGHDACTDADTDGDGVLDGQDDADHDGLSNEFEVRRPADWDTQAWTSVPPSGYVPGRTPGPTSTRSTPASPTAQTAATSTRHSATTRPTSGRLSGPTRPAATRTATPPRRTADRRPGRRQDPG